MGDDLDDVGIVIASVAHIGQFGICDLARVGNQCASEAHGGGGFRVLAATVAIRLDLSIVETGLAADGGMSRQAVLARILLCQRQGNALPGLCIEAASVGDAMQTEEGLERFGRIGEHLEKVRHDTQLRLDGGKQCLLFSVGGFVGNDIDSGHVDSPISGGLIKCAYSAGRTLTNFVKVGNIHKKQLIISKIGIMSDRFSLLTVFVAVAEAQSFAAAARRLGISPPVVTRAVVSLEERLGVTLFMRTTRVVRLTDAGARYLDDARRILIELDEADAAARGVNTEPHGQLAVTAPVLFGRLYVMPILTEYQSRFSKATVSALFVDRLVNLIEEGIDAGIRIGPLPDSSLRAIRVGKVKRVLVGSQAYFAKHGVPSKPADLIHHRIISASGVTPTNEWSFQYGSEKMSVRVQPGIIANTNDSVIQAVNSGYGLARLMSYQVAAQVLAGELQIVLVDYEGPALPLHVVHREGRLGSAKVRSFVDLAVARLRTIAFC